MERAIVILGDQVNPAPFRSDPVRHRRRAALEREPRRHAETSQRGLLTALRTRRAAGQVTAIQPLWIVNAVTATATPTVLAELAAPAPK
ncbi:hypothetical protein J5X84_38485 [Streptosporangiaceae bacterium NEAU-GS5]|nr:hypothetical protein [Streptosporangiaceae bacterium NEAU-GS5]